MIFIIPGQYIWKLLLFNIYNWGIEQLNRGNTCLIIKKVVGGMCVIYIGKSWMWCRKKDQNIYPSSKKRRYFRNSCTIKPPWRWALLKFVFWGEFLLGENTIVERILIFQRFSQRKPFYFKYSTKMTFSGLLGQKIRTAKRTNQSISGVTSTYDELVGSDRRRGKKSVRQGLDFSWSSPDFPLPWNAIT